MFSFNLNACCLLRRLPYACLHCLAIMSMYTKYKISKQCHFICTQKNVINFTFFSKSFFGDFSNDDQLNALWSGVLCDRNSFAQYMPGIQIKISQEIDSHKSNKQTDKQKHWFFRLFDRFYVAIWMTGAHLNRFHFNRNILRLNKAWELIVFPGDFLFLLSFQIASIDCVFSNCISHQLQVRTRYHHYCVYLVRIRDLPLFCVILNAHKLIFNSRISAALQELRENGAM